uniref:EGF-like domain-containing protein n=1 Tax=Chromera velia CCMP2878 TaxID=1169474 RepID=A0A0G4I0S6_9ALVE|eukprot:Cvel_10018.t1-p1 / transcript=Cvel_10018.t1 / gene=Cvel_10018 / organism=Chromera_velia_CCMP2878 / gene_product=hypothetical protein / transcript_product=hypothetical protein / location=Cvel_scaffold594:52736-59414(+) / protein_length=1303 / sequence_SO=supercontig / SO=protein_coding / is_pseudo=false
MLPPAGIGNGHTWTKDNTITFNDRYTVYKDYSGAVCPGRFRAGTNFAWWDDSGCCGGYGSAEHGPAGAWDGGAGFASELTATGVAAEGSSAAEGGNYAVILSMPCKITVKTWMVQARGDGHGPDSAPSEATLFGSNDNENWIRLGSFTGETGWTTAEERNFTADASQGAFSYVKAVGHKMAYATSVSSLCWGDVRLYGTLTEAVEIPPSDIGRGDTWTKDTNPTFYYNGLQSLYTDYAGGVCPGRYRVRSNWEWIVHTSNTTFDGTEWAPSGAFDRLTIAGAPADSKGFHVDTVTVPGSGTSSGSDSEVHLILELPCRLRLAQYGMQVRDEACCFSYQGISKAAVYGSNDMSTWTALGSYSGETSWTQAETKTFVAESATGPFKFLKFDLLKLSQAADEWISVSEIPLHAVGWEAALETLPPSDIGKDDTWTKDFTVSYGGLYTIYKDHTGGICPGRYRAKTNTDWAHNTNDATFGSNEWSPAGAFDRLDAGSNVVSGYHPDGTVANSGTSDGTDGNVELVLEAPCLIHPHSYQITTRADNPSDSSAPSKANVYGSLGGSTWTLIGSFVDEMVWGQGVTKTFYATSPDLGPFNHFKWDIQKRASTSAGTMAIGDLMVQSSDISTFDEILPPSDLGNSTEWKKDPSEMYNGLPSIYKDHTGTLCPGRYRVKTNQDWWPASKSWYSYDTNEWPPNALFDKQKGVSYAVSGYSTVGNVANSGQSASGDGNAEILIHTPCSFVLKGYELEARVEADAGARIPVRGTVYGSTDGLTWTTVSIYEDSVGWSAESVKTFWADTSLGPFNHWKFDFHKVPETSDSYVAFGEIQMIALNVTDLCSDGAHNCHANAACENAVGSFTCSCNYGFTGDGLSCSALTLIPPADIGNGGTWTKDSTVTYNSLPTFSKDYTGAVCPGTYRVRSNTNWFGNSGASILGSEWPPSGVFDRQVAFLGQNNGYSSNGAVTNSGTDSGTDIDVQLWISLPCHIKLASFGIQPRGDPGEPRQVPSKVTVYGSTDAGTTWTTIASFSEQIHWEAGVTRGFAGNKDLGPFNEIFFGIQKVSAAYNTEVVVGDIELYAEVLNQIPPPDIGTASSWTKDPSVTYGGFYTAYRDYTGVRCPGRYRAMTNTLWWDDGGWYTYDTNEWPISGAFDQTGSADANNVMAYNVDDTVTVSGTSAASDSSVELVLQTPCSLFLNQFSIRSRISATWADHQSPSKMVVSGSTDMSTWTEVASFDGETVWTGDEVKTWSANDTLGPFNYFKFDAKRIAGTADEWYCIADISLFAFITGKCMVFFRGTNLLLLCSRQR